MGASIPRGRPPSSVRAQARHFHTPFRSRAASCEAAALMPEHRLHARCGCASIGSAEHAGHRRRPPLRPAHQHAPFRARPPVRRRAPGARRHARRRRASGPGHGGARRPPRRPGGRASSCSTRSASTCASVTRRRRGVAWRYDGRELTRRRRRRATTRPASPSPTAPRRAAASTSSSPTSTTPIARARCGASARKRTRATAFPCHDSPHVKMTTEIVARVPARLVRAVERRARLEEQAEGRRLASSTGR